MKVMSEVKTREDEYELTKSIAQYIINLPETFELAKRDRKLLIQGMLHRVNPAQEETDSYRIKTRLPVRRNSPPGFSRSARLVGAINEWEQRRVRSGSLKSIASDSTSSSLRSQETAQYLDHPVTTPSSFVFQTKLNGSKDYSSRRGIKSPLGELQYDFSSTPQTPPSSSKTPSADLIKIFVFSDLILCATCSRRPHRDGQQEWMLLEIVGLSRVLHVKERAGDPAGD